VSKFKSSHILNVHNEQKYSLEGGGSTAADVEICSRNKKSVENFLKSFNKMINKAKNLIENENSLNLEKIVLNNLILFPLFKF
jgi:hypothetical protein